MVEISDVSDLSEDMSEVDISADDSCPEDDDTEPGLLRSTKKAQDVSRAESRNDHQVMSAISMMARIPVEPAKYETGSAVSMTAVEPAEYESDSEASRSGLMTL